MPIKSLESYINQYGIDNGTIRYNKTVKEREDRILRRNGKSINVLLNTDDERCLAIENGNAVKCLECGYVGTRLQHTHFKYNCTGRFNSGREYMLVYPDAKVVSPNLVKLTGGTLENYITKYGIEEGTKRWDAYKQKQAVSNSFAYKHQKHGWTKEQYDEYNGKRASTLENFIKRYGVEKGTMLRGLYAERQRYTTSLQYFIDEYGNEEGTLKYNNFDHKRTQHESRWISMVEIDFYNALLQHIPTLMQQIRIVEASRWSYDMGDIKLKKLIEFNGTVYHMDPKKYGPEDKLSFLPKSAKEIWAKDERKKQDAINNGYELLVIWEDEWKKSHQQQTIKKVVQWWFGEDYVI